MPSTYDPTLATDKDWVRFQISDRGSFATPPTITGAVLQDEEISAILAEEANKYLAAARCGDVIVAQRRGLTSKSVGNLSVSFGNTSAAGYEAHIQRLRERGCQLLLGSDGKGSVLRVL